MSRLRFLPGEWALHLCWRGGLGLLSTYLFLVGYALTQSYPLFPASPLPLTELDRAVPLWPWTVWLYNSLAVAIVVAWVIVPGALGARRLFLSLGISTTLCFAVFAVFPTSYPRELYPLPANGGLAVQMLEWIRLHDDPTNCFPSMHVALACCVALNVRGCNRFAAAVALPWTVLLALSTLTTKQHFVSDVFGGIAVGAAGWALAHWATRPGRQPLWALGLSTIRVRSDHDRRHLSEVHRLTSRPAWTLEELDLPAPGSLPALPDDVVRFLSQVVYVEEIAGQNFSLLARATQDEQLREVYSRFSNDERRHAAGLRRILQAHGHRCAPPGLGTAMLLHHFERLNPDQDADTLLVVLAIPVFETFLDAGTIPFLRRHPDLQGPALEALLDRVCRDEGYHLAVNWNVCREAARTVKASRWRAWGGLRFLLNPAVWRGAAATPFLALDVFANALRLGFDVRKLKPSFHRIFWLHRRYPELAWLPPWFMFRLFVVCAVGLMLTVLVLERISPRLLRWLAGMATRLTGWAASLTFDESLLLRKVLPEARGGG